MMAKNRKYSKQPSENESTSSKTVTNKRLSRKLGIFKKGCFSSSAQRESVNIEEAQARAEEDLTRILTLARTSRGDDSDPYFFNQEDGSPIGPKKYQSLKRKRKKHASPPIKHMKSKRSLFSSSPTASPKESYSQFLALVAKEPSPKEPKILPYEEFYKHIMKGILLATECNAKDFVNEIEVQLKNSPGKSILPPLPSLGTKLSDFLKPVKETPILHQEDKVSSTKLTLNCDSALHCDVDTTLGSPFQILTPTATIKRYGSKKKGKQKVGCKFHESAMKLEVHNKSFVLDVDNKNKLNDTLQMKLGRNPLENTSYYTNYSHFIKRYERMNTSRKVELQYQSSKDNPKNKSLPTTSNEIEFNIFNGSSLQQKSHLSNTPFQFNENPSLNRISHVDGRTDHGSYSSFNRNQTTFRSHSCLDKAIFPLQHKCHIPFSQLPKPASPDVLASGTSLPYFASFSPFSLNRTSRKMHLKPCPSLIYPTERPIDGSQYNPIGSNSFRTPTSQWTVNVPTLDLRHLSDLT